MSFQAVEHLQPPTSFGSTLPSRVARLGRRVWDVLEAHGRARAAQELRALAARRQATQPELARGMRAVQRGLVADGERIRQASAARDYARRCLRWDPRLVAEVNAAADRHERVG